MRYLTALILSLGLLYACSQPTRDFDHDATRLGYVKQLVKGEAFLHAAYLKGKPGSGDRVYVYLPGDGSPWVNRSHISEDPTPRYPLTLKLMHKGPEPAIYLGRPCYHGLTQSSECEPRYWTSARYSSKVVASMRAVLRKLLASYTDIRITLIGYSGGGTLAVLMAADLTGVDQLITLAGNLDTEAWTERHRYSPLLDSLNPVSQAPLPASIRQTHIIGAQDQNITTRMIQKFASKQSHAEVIILPEFTHKCCWEQYWPELLEQVR